MSNQPDDLSSMIRRVDRLGSASSLLFGRIYRGLRRGADVEPTEQFGSTAEEMRALRRALQRKEQDIERLHGIIHRLEQGIILQDVDGRIILQNEAARNLMGGQRNFRNSELVSLLNAYKDITQLSSEVEPLGEPTRLQVNNLVIGAQVAAVGDSQGTRLGTLILLRDVTSDALADRLKDQFITAISHELRTPMTAIKGAAEILANTPEGHAPNRKFLDTLSRNVDILDRMIVELLDISEMGASTFQIRHDPVAVPELLDAIERGLKPELKQAQIELKRMFKAPNRLRIMGDYERLRWALGHLLQNGVRYTEPGGRINLLAMPNGDTHISIQVLDSGVGISRKDLPHIFERFYRGEPRTRTGKLLDPRGLGQGLFVAKTVVEAHGGYITAQSEPGQGSIFTVVLPFEPTSAA